MMVYNYCTKHGGVTGKLLEWPRFPDLAYFYWKILISYKTALGLLQCLLTITYKFSENEINSQERLTGNNKKL